MRTTANALLVAACVLVLTSACAANPVVLWYIRDTPVGPGNGVWDDQWSGGTVLPPGEVVLWEGPDLDPDCGSLESANSFARLGEGAEALRAYLDPPFNHTQPAGTVTALLSFRQTCWELAFVTIELYKVDLFGGNPEFLVADVAEIATSQWPPITQFFVLGDIPEIEMTNDRFMVVVSSDGQCTDLVWDCIPWEGWIQLPEDDPFNPVALTDWGTIKALYR
jgi:hypothetical protein